MPTEHDRDSKTGQQPTIAYFALIFGASVLVLVGVWIYFLVGGGAVDMFTKAIITLALLGVIVFVWRVHRWRRAKALELLQRWADKDDAPSRRRGP